MKLLERFLKYVSFDTQSDPDSGDYPSTTKQLLLLDHIAKELSDMGLTDVERDEWGYVMATIPPTIGYEDRPTIGFLAHVDTSPDVCGANVRPQVVPNYDGGDIMLNDSEVLSPVEFPDLCLLKGDTIITTDGTTLLGADDKAGVAAIVTAADYLLAHPEVCHGKIRLGFTPDEEVGRGVDHFDVAKFGAAWAYTVDGGKLGELEYENFNAATVRVTIHGKQIHPGSGKNRMVNSLQVAARFNALMPPMERPEYTEGYEGFFHLISLCGDVAKAEMEYIIRDHSHEDFERRKELVNVAAQTVERIFGNGVIFVETEDQYYNMAKIVQAHPEIIQRAKSAMARAGIVPITTPIRGGTDGARLSYMGLPCPNLFAGGANFHSTREYCSLQSMEKAIETVVNIAREQG